MRNKSEKQEAKKISEENEEDRNGNYARLGE